MRSETPVTLENFLKALFYHLHHKVNLSVPYDIGHKPLWGKVFSQLWQLGLNPRLPFPQPRLIDLEKAIGDILRKDAYRLIPPTPGLELYAPFSGTDWTNPYEAVVEYFNVPLVRAAGLVVEIFFPEQQRFLLKQRERGRQPDSTFRIPAKGEIVFSGIVVATSESVLERGKSWNLGDTPLDTGDIVYTIVVRPQR